MAKTFLNQDFSYPILFVVYCLWGNTFYKLELDEPAADLAIALAIASSLRDKPIGEDLAAIGEIGLTGEIRSVPSINQRLQELARLGFKRCVIPAHCKDDIKLPKDMKLLPAKNVRDAVTAIFI